MPPLCVWLGSTFGYQAWRTASVGVKIVGSDQTGRSTWLKTRLPAFTRIEPYRSPDGQTEIDALAENSERWAVEVKWRQKRVGRSELEQLLAAAAGLNARAWCVSQAGFTPDALTFAANNAILLSNAADLAALAKLAR
ncbi:restriction endonuclease [Candidatus Amarolinea dominans]|uniref:restriction endonuclease n=1 Tax=Candidatus Amarolinea dominans TaxID=3140696 RepID=UPI00313542B5|nr:restriction endonuclease [Anaerolineae bacterium]